MSRDDSDISLVTSPASALPPHLTSSRSSNGLKGRLKRALSLSTNRELEGSSGSNSAPEREKAAEKAHRVPSATGKTGPTHTPKSSGSGESTSPPHTPTSDAVTPPPASKPTSVRGKAKSLFNAKFNASTDNISLSSTVSSASVMIRKLGNMGKLARRNSLMGITSLFKDKKSKDGSDANETGSGKKSSTKKSERSEPSVTLATAELERGSFGDDLKGLSPAAKLARQHTLRSNAADAARARAAQQAADREREAREQREKEEQAEGALPLTWDRNTAKRGGPETPRRLQRPPVVTHEGVRVLVEDDDDDFAAQHRRQDSGDHDSGSDSASDEWDQVDESSAWAVGIRRSIERTRRPSKGILKTPPDSKYDQDKFLDNSFGPNSARVRSNSYTTTPGELSAPGPLARIPSPDPDHIDGLHKSSEHAAASSSSASFIPPFSFEPEHTHVQVETPDRQPSPNPPDRSIFAHPNLNSSAPALTLFNSSVTAAPPLTHRSATTPAKRLAFAQNLSIYDTFPPSVYDRRSEPATCNRLTPALAQRIKEELNSYKMEEMEVHAASRIQ
ncbi:hypothetical protein SISSUDRAFT_979448 [Sistotremastrum suecicum HHB10207 ss-3]|uniref:Uncharacterized protein n=1 Tax=Sistotremastrum suecicum HHB10207 ss-3 TaxID=1314776 RepID=A0A166HKG6_9AGAM|nr:hypothetical protein SISSUDRAFT_979448 [Sistotremastrum suecicum HHB10207 ss-3]